ncbi:hypothetical protein D3C87_1166080 [compost metagenome]
MQMTINKTWCDECAFAIENFFAVLVLIFKSNANDVVAADSDRSGIDFARDHI